jgi:hypothetical protein
MKSVPSSQIHKTGRLEATSGGDRKLPPEEAQDRLYSKLLMQSFLGQLAARTKRDPLNKKQERNKHRDRHAGQHWETKFETCGHVAVWISQYVQSKSVICGCYWLRLMLVHISLL